jgi:hypothetical protein
MILALLPLILRKAIVVEVFRRRVGVSLALTSASTTRDTLAASSSHRNGPSSAEQAAVMAFLNY